MKALRILCNCLLLITVVIGISLVQIAVYDALAVQSSDVKAIHIAAPTDDSVAYADSYGFWFYDIKTNLGQEAKYRIRNWVGAKWWKSGMEWADKGVDVIAGVFKPIFVPIAQINAVMRFYGHNINEFDEYFLTVYKDAEAYNNALYEQFVIFANFVGVGAKSDTIRTVGENPVLIEDYVYTGDWNPSENTEYDYGRWIVLNKQLYNNTWKLNKYNQAGY